MLKLLAGPSRQTWSTWRRGWSPRHPRGRRRPGDRRYDQACRRGRQRHVRRLIPESPSWRGIGGDAQVRNRGTLAARSQQRPRRPIRRRDPPERQSKSTMDDSAEEFFTGTFETALTPDEAVSAKVFPKPGRVGYANFPGAGPSERLGRRAGGRGGGAVRVAVSGAGPVVFRRWRRNRRCRPTSPPRAQRSDRRCRWAERRHPCQRRVQGQPCRRHG